MAASKRLWLFRGVPGSGKSTAAHYAANGNPVFSADMYFESIDEHSNLVYNFDFTKLKDAHENCRRLTEQAMIGKVSDIYVTNTFTQEWEMETYYELAQKYGYTVFSLIVENRHGGENIHGVPADKVQIMRDRFSVKL
jgi:predicted kinase